MNREAELRLSSLRILVTEQIERLVSLGDPKTVRWLAERLGLFAGLDAPARPAAQARQSDRPAPSPVPTPAPAPQPPPEPANPAPPPVALTAAPGGDCPRAPEPASAPVSAPAAVAAGGWNSAAKPFHDVPTAAAAPGRAAGRRRVSPLGSGRSTSAPSPSGSALAS